MTAGGVGGVTPGRALRVAMVVYDDITFDSRVQREANALAAAGHEVTLFCLEGSHGTSPMLDTRVELAVVRVGGRPGAPGGAGRFTGLGSLGRRLAKVAFLATYARNLRRWGRAISRTSRAFEVWHAHDFTGLIACGMARSPRSSLVYDMHDLFFDTGAGTRLPRVLRWSLERYERRLVRDADLVVTVNQGLATYIRERHHPRSLAVVHNCVPRWSVPEPRPTLIRDAVGLAPAVPVVLYHGVIAADRGLDTLLEAMLEPGLEEAHLALLGFGPDRDRLQRVAGAPRFGGRVHVLDPVSPMDLLPWVSSADVGVMPNQPRTTNERLSTPNKLFESLAAGLPVVSSDFPERRRIILDDPLGPLGAVCDPTDPAALARAIRSISSLDAGLREDLRRRCSEAARLRWNWETEAQVLVDGYRRAIPSRRRGENG